MRYEKECQQLAEMAKTALNLPKNACKGKFEDVDLDMCIYGMELEIKELQDELFYSDRDQKTNINFKRAREEFADVAACCVGILAKLNAMEEEEEIEKEISRRSIELDLKLMC